MQKFGVGIDMEEVTRFGKLDRLKNRRFFERIFTEKEMDYCFSKKDPSPYLAARFCGKEAVVKALGSIGIHKIGYLKIEITNTTKGVPQVILHTKEKNFHIQISISHARGYAIACAIVFK